MVSFVQPVQVKQQVNSAIRPYALSALALQVCRMQDHLTFIDTFRAYTSLLFGDVFELAQVLCCSSYHSYACQSYHVHNCTGS